MRLYFIRHGQSANNLIWHETGGSQGRSEDPELTETGHKQAQLLASYIERLDGEANKNGNGRVYQRDFFGITHLYTSLMVRSVATAAYLAESLEIPLTAWPEIHETGGIYLDDEEAGTQKGLPGKTRSYFSRHYSNLILPETITEEGWWNRPFEPKEERPLRAQGVLDTLLERHEHNSDDCVAIVSHGGFYVELARVIFSIGNRQSWLSMNNTGISRFDFREDEGVSLVYHNRTDHLPEQLIT
jgi:2,3-bisphosphoglycerate-dependent phosphoglycerate mutase